MYLLCQIKLEGFVHAVWKVLNPETKYHSGCSRSQAHRFLEIPGTLALKKKFAFSYNNSATFLLMLINSRVYEGIFQRLMSCADITGLLVSGTWACISLF